MRPDAAEEYSVAIVQQMLRRDGGGDAGPGAGHEFDGARSLVMCSNTTDSFVKRSSRGASTVSMK